MRDLRAAQPRALAGSRQMARFLGGMGSPALTAAKLTRDLSFGAESETPFARVSAAAKAALAA